MKKKLPLGGYIILMIIAFLGFCFGTLASCDKIQKKPVDTFYMNADSIVTASITAAIVNPMFASANEMLNFKQRCAQEKANDSLFMSLNEKVLIDVYNVCSNKYNTSVSKNMMMDEYRANKHVYDNLTKASTDNGEQKEVSATKEELPATIVVKKSIETSYDTIIDGKKYRYYQTLEPYEQ